MILNKVNRNKIHQEFVNRGVGIVSIFALDKSEIGADITFADNTDMNLVQQIIDAHDPIPVPKPLSEVERIAIAERAINNIIMAIIMNGGM